MFELLVNLQEAARLLRMHPETLKRRARRGEIPGHKIGKRWFFRESELDAWVRGQIKFHQTQITPRD